MGLYTTNLCLLPRNHDQAAKTIASIQRKQASKIEQYAAKMPVERGGRLREAVPAVERSAKVMGSLVLNEPRTPI